MLPSLGYSFDVPHLYQYSLDRVFLICSHRACGTAVQVTPTVLLTAKHVIRDTEVVQVYSQRTQGLIGTATVYKRDANIDIAYLSFRSPTGAYMSLYPLRPGDTGPIMGEEVYSVGYPQGTSLRITAGNYFGDVSPNDNRMSTTAPITSGNSGGPMVIRKEDQYYIIGIISVTFGSNNLPIPHMNGSISYKQILK